MNTPMQSLKEHIQNMIQHGGDEDLLCVVGLIDSNFMNEEKQHIKLAFEQGQHAGLTISPNPEHYYLRNYKPKP